MAWEFQLVNLSFKTFVALNVSQQMICLLQRRRFWNIVVKKKVVIDILGCIKRAISYFSHLGGLMSRWVLPPAQLLPCPDPPTPFPLPFSPHMFLMNLQLNSFAFQRNTSSIEVTLTLNFCVIIPIMKSFTISNKWCIFVAMFDSRL